jgi:carbon starvation protein
MAVVLMLASGLVVFIVGGRYYSIWISRILGENKNNPTPAVVVNDGVDFVPTKTPIVFAHHFASIAGAGPIIGPMIALIYGWAPVWLWLLFGGLLFGAVHDYTSLYIGMREGGHSISTVARKTLGDVGFTLMICFTILMLILVTAMFLNVSCVALTSFVPKGVLELPEGQTLFRTVVQDGVPMIKVGGIASSSVILITLLAPFIGWLYIKRKVSPLICSIFALVICAISVTFGLHYPVTLNPEQWRYALAIYTLLAAGIPVWIFLQSRDFINVHLLYIGLIFMIVTVIGVIFRGHMTFDFPAMNIAQGQQTQGFIWPTLFVIVACGAISGFHSLVSTGTTCKQVEAEYCARYIGFFGMLLESLLAILVICVIVIGLGWKDFLTYQYPMLLGLKTTPNPNLTFSLAFGMAGKAGLGVAVAIGTVFGLLLLEGFVVTTLDTAVRLNRYLFEELWGMLFKNVPAFLKHYWVNSAIAVILMVYVSKSGGILVIWGIFASANQLLAALTLITVSSWLIQKHKQYSFTMIPAIFMLVTTIVMLVMVLVKTYIPTSNHLLTVIDLILIVLSAGVVWLSVKAMIHDLRKPGIQTGNVAS